MHLIAHRKKMCVGFYLLCCILCDLSYQKLLKVLALLEAQKVQATKARRRFVGVVSVFQFLCCTLQDLEQLLSVKAKAERDPCGFVATLRNGVRFLQFLWFAYNYYNVQDTIKHWLNIPT